MTSVNLVPDDVGLQRLRADNEKPAVLPNVSGIAPARPVQKNRAAGERIQPVNTERRRHGDRRKAERRTRHHAVLLDTRSQRDRRANMGNRKTDQQLLSRRIDINI